ncbi:MAG TPA: hypothetical protein VFV80_02415 [Geminicoccaceae bacterium]|nr:hypothetical protein [Geminicoccaceae bacterium]
MAEPVDNRLLFQILKGLQTRVSFLEEMLGEIRDGFASIRSHRAALQGEAVDLDRRLGELEESFERIERRLRLSEPREPS